jgi:hypothetical protein
MAQLTTGKQRYELVSPSGYGMVRMYHRNVTSNHRNTVDAKITVPPVVTRAKLIVQQKRLVPVLFQERQEI